MLKSDDQKLIDLIWCELDVPKGPQAKILTLGLEKHMAENDWTLDIIKEFIHILKTETRQFPEEWSEIKKEILDCLN